MPENQDATIVSGGRPAARFVVKQGPQIGITFPILQSKTQIGREEASDVRVQDAEVSRRHSELIWKDGEFWVQDLGSSNGTFVNGTQITTLTKLSAGDKIGVGQTVMVLELEPLIKPIPTPYDATPSAASVSAPVPVVKKSSNTGRRIALIGFGCLTLLCLCSIVSLVVLDLMDIIDLGLPILSNYQITF